MLLRATLTAKQLTEKRDFIRVFLFSDQICELLLYDMTYYAKPGDPQTLAARR